MGTEHLAQLEGYEGSNIRRDFPEQLNQCVFIELRVTGRRKDDGNSPRVADQRTFPNVGLSQWERNVAKKRQRAGSEPVPAIYGFSGPLQHALFFLCCQQVNITRIPVDCGTQPCLQGSAQMRAKPGLINLTVRSVWKQYCADPLNCPPWPATATVIIELKVHLLRPSLGRS